MKTKLTLVCKVLEEQSLLLLVLHVEQLLELQSAKLNPDSGGEALPGEGAESASWLQRLLSELSELGRGDCSRQRERVGGSAGGSDGLHESKRRVVWAGVRVKEERCKGGRARARASRASERKCSNALQKGGRRCEWETKWKEEEKGSPRVASVEAQDDLLIKKSRGKGNSRRGWRLRLRATRNPIPTGSDVLTGRFRC